MFEPMTSPIPVQLMYRELICQGNWELFSLRVRKNTNYLITESEVVTGKSQTEALPY